MVTVTFASARKNQLLAALPKPELEHLLPLLREHDFSLGHAVYEAGSKLEHVYLPTTSVVSLLSVLESGATAEIAVVGFEGIVGVALFMGGMTTPSRGIVQSAGKCLSLGADHVY